MVDDSTTKEINTLLELWEPVSLESGRDIVFELMTRTEALFGRYTDEREPFLRNLNKAIQLYEGAQGHSYKNCAVTLKRSVIGVLKAFKSNYESGFIIETGISA